MANFSSSRSPVVMTMSSTPSNLHLEIAPATKSLSAPRATVPSVFSSGLRTHRPPILMKIEGKYTTDHVPAENRVIGAIGFENNEANDVKNQITITRTFARIRETNVKKRVILPLTFVEPTDYDKVSPNDKVDIVGLDTFAPGKSLTLVAKHDGSTKDGRALQTLLN
ncbi:hypothetical protein H1R20_g11257, partial [Candolleomyces eurysporus]